MSSIIRLASALVLLPLLAQGAQEPDPSSLAPSVSIGQRVRVFAARISAERITGSVVGQDEGSISIATDKGVTVVPRGSLDSLEVSQGRGSKTKGAVRGGLLSLGILLGLGALVFQDDFDPDWGAMVTTPGVYVIAGIGAAVGAGMSSRESWKATPLPVPPPGGARLTPAPSFRFSVTF